MLITQTKNLILLLLLPLSLLLSIPTFGQNQNEIDLANEYFSQGELEKAKSLYADLSKNLRNIPAIHNNYLNTLFSLSSWKEADTYLKKLLKAYPDHYYYQIDLGILYLKQNLEVEADKQFKKVIAQVQNDQFKVKSAANYFLKNDLIQYSLDTYLSGRKASSSQSSYALELGNLYRLMNKKDQMVQEYLNFAQANPNNVNYVKNVLQNYLIEEQDLVSLETILLDKIQQSPDDFIYPELLIWTNLQQKNFYGAFIQARAIDKRLKTEGMKVMEIGMITLENKDYKTAIRIFDYMINTFSNSSLQPIAQRYLIKSREELVKTTYPVDLEEIKILIKDYQSLVDELGITPATLEALRSQALLYAFYMDKKDSAIATLNKIISMPRVDPQLVAASKIDLGDIYLLIGEPWESTLLYSQVEKSEKDQPVGYEAKLKNAKLSYYKGDFELAQEHLDILKLATTREIANDAIELSVLIRDNTIMDTSSTAMLDYANIELLLFQNNKEEAISGLDTMLIKYPGHSLTDEIYWLQSKIYLELGEYEMSISLLKNIIESYHQDILGDDAYYKVASIYDEYLKDRDKAMEYYQNFLTKYPGSIYSSEARKRYRRLRGDLVN